MVKYDNQELKERIDCQFKTRKEFAEAIGITPSGLSRLLSRGDWKAHYIQSAVRVLDIPVKDIPKYFFTNKVDGRQL